MSSSSVVDVDHIAHPDDGQAGDDEADAAPLEGAQLATEEDAGEQAREDDHGT